MPKKGNGQPAMPETGAYYAIVSAHSGKAVTAGVNNAIYMEEATGGESQQWSFVPVGAYYKLVSRLTGDVADVILAGVDNGAQIHQWEDLEAENQLWLLQPARDGLWKLKSKLSGKCLDVAGISLEEGARLQIWEDLDGENQLWRLVAPQDLPVQAPVRKPAGRASQKPAAKAGVKGADEKPAARKPAAKSAQKPAAKAGAGKPSRRKAAPKPAAKAPAGGPAGEPEGE